MKVKFDKEKISAANKISLRALSELRLKTGLEGDDFIKEQVTMLMSGTIWANMAEERDLVYYFDRPTFYDWLLRRKRKASFHLKVKDLLLNPPKVKDTVRIYEVEPKEE